MDGVLRQAGIYEIRNRVTRDAYIGESADVITRWRMHQAALRLGNHPNRILQAAWLEFGPQAFTFSLIFPLDDRALRILEERRIIEKYQPAYNIAGTLRHNWRRYVSREGEQI